MFSLRGARRAIVVGGSLAMAYTQLTTSPATTEYARAFGADSLHIGILGALPTGLFFMQFLSAILVGSLRGRRWLWFSVSLVQRFSLLPIALGPWLIPQVTPLTWIWIVIALVTINHGLLHFSSPLWMSWMGDYLPHRGLSSFWGVRHLWQQWTAAGALMLAALVIWKSGLSVTTAFALLMGVAIMVGVADILLFLKVHEPPMSRQRGCSLRSTLVAPLRDPGFRSFIQYSCFWHFSAMIGAPFIGMYLLEYVGMSLFSVLLLWAISWVGGALVAGKLGQLAEDFGNRPLLVACTALKALNMLALLFTPANPSLAFWLLVPVLMMDSQLNAGINIANQGFMLKNSPQQNRTMFIAAGTAIAGMVGGITAVTTGFGLTLIEGWSWEWSGVRIVGFHLAFAASALFRLMAIALAKRVHEPGSRATSGLMRQLACEFYLLRERNAETQRVDKTAVEERRAA